MLRMMRSGVAATLLLSASISIQAAGLGKLTVNSALGQNLNAEIDLVSLQPGEADAISARLAPPEAFREARIEYSPALRLLRFSVEKRSDGRPYLKVTSIGPVNEPFLDALIEVVWPAGRLQREYPILLDPPGYASRVTAPSVAAAPAAPAAAVAAETPPAAAPAAAPSAPAAEAATGAPSAQAELGTSGGQAMSDTYGPVEKGENLTKIAGQVKPAEVSLEQMLVALYRQNKGAFVGDNMNRLKTGQILKVPSAEEVAKIKPGDAGREIRTQVADWKAYREKLASSVAATPALGEPSNVASGQVASAAVTPPPSASAEPKDTLRLSRTQGGKAGTGAAATQNRLNALQEELTAKDQALKEAQSRVADLEKQIQDMQRLLHLTGAAPAKTPEKVAAATPAAPAATPTATPPAVPGKAAPEAAKPAEAPQANEPAKASVPPKPATEVAKAPTQAAKPKAPAKVVQRKPVAPPPSFLDEIADNPTYLAAGVGGIALLGLAGFLVVRRRRSNLEAPNSAMTSAFPSDLKPSPSTTKPAAGLVDTGNSSFLTDFDKTGPGTIDTDEVDPVAEAEVYMAYGRDAQAEEILKEAMARDRNRHEIALKLLEIYHARKSATAFETVAKELRAAVGESHPLWQKAAAMGAQIDPNNPLYAAAAAGTSTFVPLTAPPAPAAQPKPDLDFDLDTNTAAAQAAAPAPSFDLDLGTSKPAAAPADAPPAPSHALDFDLAPSGSTSAPMDMPVESSKEGKPAFDFDLSGLEFGGSKPEPAHAASAPAAPSGSIGLADLNLDEPASESNAEAVGTKLELAKAYLEIGDKDGAREILHEVAKEGSSAQKEEAKKLIASL